MANVLIIDDDPSVCKMISNLVRRMGHVFDVRHNAENGLKQGLAGDYDLVLLDVHMPDGSGLDILPKLKANPSKPEVIIMTGYGSAEGAEIAIQNGAWDYLIKDSSAKEITLSLKRVLQYREAVNKVKAPLKALQLDGIVGACGPMKDCFNLVARAAVSDTNVLLTGETGTGKEIFARAIHDNSGRSQGNFVVVDCAALPDTLVESLLFGHIKGAFTGADQYQEGLVAQADGGTLFLDEIGELPMGTQKVFLRVLQERLYRPIGGKQEAKSDFRLIAATNRNLDNMVTAGKFRADLLFRLRSLVIDVPPLRMRGKDVTDIAMYYMQKFCNRFQIGTKGFAPAFLEALETYAWPGNVRELISAIERAVSISDHEQILFPIHLPVYIRTQLVQNALDKKMQDPSPDMRPSKQDARGAFPPLKDLLEETEKSYLKDIMAFAGGNIKDICRISGLSRSRLYERLKKYDLRSTSGNTES